MVARARKDSPDWVRSDAKRSERVLVWGVLIAVAALAVVCFALCLFTPAHAEAAMENFSFAVKSPERGKTVDYSTQDAKDVESVGLEVRASARVKNVDLRAKASAQVGKSGFKAQASAGVERVGLTATVSASAKNADVADQASIVEDIDPIEPAKDVERRAYTASSQKETSQRETEPRVEVLRVTAKGDTVRFDEGVPLGEMAEEEEGARLKSGPRVEIEQEEPGSINIRIGDKYYDDGKDLVKFGESIEIKEDEVIEGDVVAIGGSVTVRGKVNGDVVSVGGDVNVGPNGVIGGDAVTVGGELNKELGGVIEGDEVVTGGFIPQWLFRGAWPRFGVKFASLAFSIGKSLVVLLVAWLIVAIFGDRVKNTAGAATSRMLPAFGIGLVTVLLAPIAMILLLITIIGIPVAIILPFALVVVGFFGYTAVALALGQRIVGGRVGATTVSPVKGVLVGVVILEGILLVGKFLCFLGGPFCFIGTPIRIIGYALVACVVVIGIGATLLSRFGQPMRIMRPFAPAGPGGLMGPSPGGPGPAGPGPTGPGPGAPGGGAPSAPTGPAT